MMGESEVTHCTAMHRMQFSADARVVRGRWGAWPIVGRIRCRDALLPVSL